MKTKQKRYLVSASFFIYANNDFEAIKKAKEIEADERLGYDNKYDIDRISEHNFGSMKSRPVDMNTPDPMEGMINTAHFLYETGKHGTEIHEIMSNDFQEIDFDTMNKIINEAYERFKEKSISLENK